MSVEGEICALVRGAKDPRRSVVIAAQIYERTTRQIQEILILHGLMDLDGNFLEPIRLTGKEKTMKQLKKAPTYRWSVEKKDRLVEMYEAGSSVEEIAEDLNTDTESIFKAISRFNIVRMEPTAPSQPAPDPTVPELVDPPLAVAMEEPVKKDPPETVASVLSRIVREERAALGTVSMSEASAKKLAFLVTYAMQLTLDAKTFFLDDRCHEAFYSLGKQEKILDDAKNILSKQRQPGR